MCGGCGERLGGGSLEQATPTPPLATLSVPPSPAGCRSPEGRRRSFFAASRPLTCSGAPHLGWPRIRFRASEGKGDRSGPAPPLRSLQEALSRRHASPDSDVLPPELPGAKVAALQQMVRACSSAPPPAKKAPLRLAGRCPLSPSPDPQPGERGGAFFFTPPLLFGVARRGGGVGGRKQVASADRLVKLQPRRGGGVAAAPV